MVLRRLVPWLALLAAFGLTACGGGGGPVLDVLDTGTTTPTDPPPADPPPAEPPPPAPPAPPPSTSMSAEELAEAQACLDLLNAERDVEGLPPLAWEESAAEVAYQHSLDMEVRDYFAHTNPDGLGPGGRLAAADVSYASAGENIYWASWHASAEQAMDAWMASTGHRNNILRSGWTHVGIGVHQGTGGSWWTQVFLSR